jgi:riboflavin synthase
MFTGLVEKKGKVIANTPTDVGCRLVIDAHFDSLQLGESIAVNGVCLTLRVDESQHLIFDVSPETCALTTLVQLSVGEAVNLERALLASARLGGHYVSGHVDTTAVVESMIPVEDYMIVTIGHFKMPADNYLLPKGSITLDGVSLTINQVKDGCIEVMLVPHTQEVTTLGALSVGRRLNIEFDYLTRIVAHQLSVMIPGFKASGVEK